jgi:pimeloyl-ACP methyl ester carboxylesterase
VDAALQGIPSIKAGEVEKVMIQGLPEGPDGSPISTGFWEWKPKLTVYYERSGVENSKAPAVLFLPGFGVGTFHFEKQLRDLGRDHRVWTMDFLGQGMSLPGEDPAPSSIASEEAFWGFGQDSQPWAEELVYSVDLWQNQVQHFIEEVLLGFVILSCNVCFAEMPSMFSLRVLACLLETPHRLVDFFFLYS